MKSLFCNKCGEELTIEDDEDVLEDKSIYCEECYEKITIKLDE